MAPGPVEVARGTVLDDRYRIEDIIGRGGMAAVYRARDTRLKRDVAVKVFPPSLDSDEVRRYGSEVAVLARVEHPGLVALHDAGTAFVAGEPQTYIVMELVSGPSLADLLRAGPLSPQHTAWIGHQLAAAIASVHAADVVHRDIKPANILVVDRSGGAPENPETVLATGPVVKLADFGIARYAGSARLTMTGTTLGTATYLSPEQAAGNPVEPATDVYALALVLLECLTGRKAFEGTVAEVAAARLSRAPSIPGTLGPRWQRVLREMTTIDPADRMPMSEVADALLPLAGPEGQVTALPDPGGLASAEPVAPESAGSDDATQPLTGAGSPPRDVVSTALGEVRAALDHAVASGDVVTIRRIDEAMRRTVAEIDEVTGGRSATPGRAADR